MLSKNWVAFLDIANALVHADRISSSTLSPLYEGTSRNNSGFMLAVLLGEGLVCPLDRHYMRQDFKPFLQHINADWLPLAWIWGMLMKLCKPA
jgi:hypothetical protein